MMKIKMPLALMLLSGLTFVACNNNNQSADDANKALLDTVSLSNKSFALAYQDGDKIVATSIDTMKQISFGGATDPAIAPDGNKLAYTVHDSLGNRSIWVADLENKSQLQLKVNSSNYYQAMWSPNGSAIVFNIYSAQNVWKIGIIKADNTGFAILDAKSNIDVYGPTWKNDHELLGHDLTNLYTFDLSGKIIDTKLIADLIGKDLSVASNDRFFYSKDASKIIFNAQNDDPSNDPGGPVEAVYVLNLSDKSIKRISPVGVSASGVFLTADDRIFYSAAGNQNGQSKIYISDFAGNVKKLVEKGMRPSAALK